MRALIRLAALLLLVLPARADPAALAEDLGADDAQRRAMARARLMKLGRQAWPALEAVRDDPDPEVRGQARRILRAWGWIPPEHRDILNPTRLAGLRGGNPSARAINFEQIIRMGERGVAALEEVYDTPPVDFDIVLEPYPKTVSVGDHCLRFRIVNVSRHPGWGLTINLGATQERWEPLGRRVAFPRRKRRTITRRGFGCGRALFCRDVHINTARRTEWVLPGQAMRALPEVAISLKEPGVGTYLISGAPADGELRVKIVKRGETIVPDTVLASRVRFGVAPLRLTLSALPPRSTWGRPMLGVTAHVRLGSRDMRVSLRGNTRHLAPRDFGSSWYAALDNDHRVVAHGPLDQGSRALRRYRAQELAPAGGLECRLPRPRGLPSRATMLLVGVALDGATVCSEPVLLADVLE